MKSTTQAADNLINEMEADSGKAIAELATPTPTRRRAMFFEKVGEKTPPWGKTLVLFKTMNSKDYFTTGRLSSITELEHGFSYRFTDDHDGITDAHEFEYFLVPVVS